jgi:hypothetical protein
VAAAIRLKLGASASSLEVQSAIKEDLASRGISVDHVIEVSVDDATVYATEGGGGSVAGINPRSLGHAETVATSYFRDNGATGNMLKIKVDGQLCWNCYQSLRAYGAAVNATTVEVEADTGTTITVDVATGARITNNPGARVYYRGPGFGEAGPAGPGGGPGFQSGGQPREWGGPTGGGIHDEEE